MTANIVCRITISATPKEVFAYLADLKHHFLWNPQLHSIRPIKMLDLNIEYLSVSKLLGVKVKGKNKVTKFEKNKILAIQNDTGALRYKVEFKLRDKLDKTSLIYHVDVSSTSKSFAFSGPILKALAQREINADLKTLKFVVENKVSI
ncbi:MAG: hypothetical protein NVS1B10_07080 [Candidatus Saccharimonadales bacterium]